jgi:hypothetical protein
MNVYVANSGWPKPSFSARHKFNADASIFNYLNIVRLGIVVRLGVDTTHVHATFVFWCCCFTFCQNSPEFDRHYGAYHPVWLHCIDEHINYCMRFNEARLVSRLPNSISSATTQLYKLE